MYDMSLFWPKIANAINEFCGSAADPSPRINTAIGCIPVKFEDLVPWILPNLLGMAGGISFLLMVYGFILWAISEGDPKKKQAAQETVTSAVTGLLFCIFGLFIIRLIAVDIIKIPGF